MLGQCDKCPQWLEPVSEEDLSLMVTWYQWERVVQKTSGKEKKQFGGQEDGEGLQRRNSR